MATSARREGDQIVVRIDLEDVQELRVAMQPCPCKNTKSSRKRDIAARFVKGLGIAMHLQSHED